MRHKFQIILLFKTFSICFALIPNNIFHKLYILTTKMDKKQAEDPSTKELNAFVQNMLKQMQERFEEMSGNIIGRVDEMGKRIDDIEKSINEIMNDLGDEEEPNKGK